MRFMMIVKGDANYEAGRGPSQVLLDNMGAYMTQVAQAGALISAEGLKPSRDGVQLTTRAGKTAVIDGPFTEAKEIIGGYAIVEAKSKVEAIQMAMEFIDVHIRSGVTDVDVEVRELYDAPPTPSA